MLKKFDIQYTKAGKQNHGARKSFYKSTIDLQQQRKLQSTLFVFDISKRVHIFGQYPFDLLAYIIGMAPMKLLPAHDTSHGLMAVQPIDVELIGLDKDDMAVIIRRDNQFNEEITHQIVDYIIKNLPDWQYSKIIQYLQNQIEKVPYDEQIKDILQAVKELNAWEKNKKYSMKHKILMVYLDPFFNGISCITRVLSFDSDKVGIRKSQYLPPMMSKMYDELDELKKYNKEIKCVILFDDRYFVLSKVIANQMNYPGCINCDYVAICGSEDDVKEVKEEEIELCDEGENGEYRICVMKHKEKGLRLKIIPEKTLFDDVAIELKILTNCPHFIKWIDMHDFFLWSGRLAQMEISAFRGLKLDLKRIKQENDELKQKLNDYQ